MRQLTTAILLLALAPFAAAEMKIAIVDPMRAIGESDAAKKAFAALDKEMAPDIAQARKLETELGQCEQKFKRDGATMTATDAAKLKGECEVKYAQYRQLGQVLQKTRGEREQQIFQGLLPKYEQAVEAVVKSAGYDLVLHKDAAVFSKPGLNVTDMITAKINAAGAAPAAPAAAAPAKAN